MNFKEKMTIRKASLARLKHRRQYLLNKTRYKELLEMRIKIIKTQ